MEGVKTRKGEKMESETREDYRGKLEATYGTNNFEEGIRLFNIFYYCILDNVRKPAD